MAPLIGRPEMGFPVLRTTDRLFEGIADTEHPQGVAALVVPRKWKLADLLATPGGSLFAAAGGAGGSAGPGKCGNDSKDGGGVWRDGSGDVGDGTGRDGEPVLHRRRCGLRRERRCICRCWRDVAGDSADAIEDEWDSHAGVVRAGCEGRVGASMSPWEVDWCEPIALLVGNEGAGLPEEIVRGADARVHIPMARGVESLNAAAAAAVLFYEAYRQREQKS